MATRKIEVEELPSYFDSLSKKLGAELVEIEVAGLGLGDQIEAEWVALLGISYDPKDNVIAVTTEAVEHLIHAPQTVYVDEEAGDVKSIDMTDKDGNHHIVLFKKPLALPK
jgi:hypothetical protein